MFIEFRRTKLVGFETRKLSGLLLCGEFGREDPPIIILGMRLYEILVLWNGRTNYDELTLSLIGSEALYDTM